MSEHGLGVLAYLGRCDELWGFGLMHHEDTWAAYELAFWENLLFMSMAFGNPRK
jgi:hypothetical protein